MTKNNKIYFDITNLIEWKGNLTGIPRTTDEIALRLRQRDDAVFVRWNFILRVFELVDIEDYYKNIAPANRDYFKHRPAPPAVASRQESKEIIKKIIRRSRHLSRATEIVKEAMSSTDASMSVGSYEKDIKLDEGDIFFIPCGLWDNEPYIQSVLRLKKSRAKIVFLSYDILPIVVPQFSGQWGGPMKDFTQRVTSASDLVFSISEHTKKDLQRYLQDNNLSIPSIETIRLGDSFANSLPVVPTDPKFVNTGIANSGEQFILCTGTIEARKNHTLLYYVYKLAKSRKITLPKLIIVGRQGYRTQDIIDIIQDDPEVSEDITLLMDVSDEELSWLYQHCKFSIYPSFYEGWGLPIAESISKGVPCIASNTSSMVEVAPGYVEHFNPVSPDECLAAIQKYLNTANYEEAKKHAAEYNPVSWDYTYGQIETELEKLKEGDKK